MSFCKNTVVEYRCLKVSGGSSTSVFGQPFSIVKLRQAGIMEAWRSKWWRNDEEACSKEIRVSEGEQLDLVYLAGPFFVFVSSLVLSVLVALCDWAWRKGKLRPVMARLRRWAAPSGDSAT